MPIDARPRRTNYNVKSLVAMGLVVFVVFCSAVSLHRTLTLHSQVMRGLAEVEAVRHRLAPDFLPIMMPAYGRPEYLKQVLQRLSRVSHIQETVLVVSQDGTNPEVAALIDAVDFMPVVHLYHTQPYMNVPGWFLKSDFTTASNVYFLLRFGFEFLKSPSVIVLESDIAPSVDFYDYFQWAHKSIHSDPKLKEKVFTVNSFSMGSRPYAATFELTEARFMVWGWMCPGYMWKDVSRGWTWFHNWDHNMEKAIRQPLGRVSVGPRLSRVKNIGMTGINFDVQDAQEAAMWAAVHISEKPVDYSNAQFVLKPPQDGYDPGEAASA